MPENIEVAVVCAKFEEDVFRTIPLVEYFFDEILAIMQPKTNGPFVCFGAGITLNRQSHLIIFAHNPFQYVGKCPNPRTIIF